MAIRKCRECGNSVSTKAKACPSCGAVQQRQVGCLGLVFAACFAVVLFTILFPSGTPSGRGAPERGGAQSRGGPSDRATPETEPNWMYRHSDYEMGPGRVHQAVAVSENEVRFSFPYSGAQRASLILRTHPKYGKDLMLRIERGQLLVNSYDDSEALVRFDDAEALSFAVTESTDHDSTIAFFENYHGFVGKMLRAERVRITIPVYQEGNPVFEFDVGDFSVPEYLEQAPAPEP